MKAKAEIEWLYNSFNTVSLFYDALYQWSISLLIPSAIKVFPLVTQPFMYFTVTSANYCRPLFWVMPSIGPFVYQKKKKTKTASPFSVEGPVLNFYFLLNIHSILYFWDSSIKWWIQVSSSMTILSKDVLPTSL